VRSRAGCAAGGSGIARGRQRGRRGRQGEASREHTAADAQLATLKQVQAAAEEEAPLHEWLERHQLAALPRFWQKIRIDHGWETAVESVLRERLHALELGDSGALGRTARR
jgi:chromosome segregation protein